MTRKTINAYLMLFALAFCGCGNGNGEAESKFYPQSLDEYSVAYKKDTILKPKKSQQSDNRQLGEDRREMYMRGGEYYYNYRGREYLFMSSKRETETFAYVALKSLDRSWRIRRENDSLFSTTEYWYGLTRKKGNGYPAEKTYYDRNYNILKICQNLIIMDYVDKEAGRQYDSVAYPKEGCGNGEYMW